MIDKCFDIASVFSFVVTLCVFAGNAAATLDKEAEETKELTHEERMFKVWLNSQDLGESGQIVDVYEDVAHTPALLRVIDAIRPGSVDWKRVNTTKLNKVTVACT